ncbi:Aldo/keto reductase [Obba rivulosa]|uniref:Aldo/keto reductase n=1 Tax=Obba rivulosa TaxID=1052685 RepID=A0A8E2DNV4_9APHY|nr:Aldo/keto reductase [Obba rivulosa]
MSDFFKPPPEPKTKLGRHRQLSLLAGVHVSPLALGGAALGEKWSGSAMGEMTRERAIQVLDAYYEAGGNFIDTANAYQDEESENIIGEWMEARENRDQMVIATKYSANWKRADPIPQKTHYVGNSMKALQVSFEASLKKLRTSYVDILYVHFWDYTTGIPEMMNGLHHLVADRKVLYLGISDAPAWVVAEANTYAKLTGKTPFSIYQGAWNVFQRDFEREIIPMARAHGLALAPWNVVAGGKIRTDAEEEARKQSKEIGRQWFVGNPQFERTEEERKVCLALEEVAKQVGASNIRAVAIAYLMQKTPYVFPIVGCRKVEQLMQNIEALDVALSDEQIKYLESIAPFKPGFPNDMIGDGTSYDHIHASTGHFDKWPLQPAIRPAKT